MKFYDSINRSLAKRGINTITGSMYDFITMWKEWYRGNVNDFHNYKVKTVTGRSVSCERLTLNMAKKIAEDFSKLLWTEKVKIELDTDRKTKQLWSILDSKKNNFSINISKSIERAFALGTEMLVEYKYKGETLIDYIEADLIIPFEYNNSYINGVIGLSTFIEKDIEDKNLYYSHLTEHRFDGRKYSVENLLFVSTDKNSLGEEVSFAEAFPHIPERTEYETDTPHFQILRPNVLNNLDLRSPMGISIYANHIDKMKAIDIKYDSFSNEFIMGAKRIMIDRTTVKPAVNPEDGSLVQYFDTNDKTYVAVNGMDKQPIKEIDFTIRDEEHIDSINSDLNYLSAGVGLGQDFYNFNGSSAKTATEVLSEQSDTFRSRENHWIVIKDVIYDLVKSICYLEGINTKYITITPDDSVIEDKAAESKQALIEYNAGLIDEVEYFKLTRGLDEQDSIDYVDTINQRKKATIKEEPTKE